MQKEKKEVKPTSAALLQLLARLFCVQVYNYMQIIHSENKKKCYTPPLGRLSAETHHGFKAQYFISMKCVCELCERNSKIISQLIICPR